MTAESKILSLASYQDYNGIADYRHDLVIDRMKLDRFFSLFLDKFEKKMNPDITDTPIWKLYKAKMKEYAEVSRAITLSDYYLQKASNRV